MGQDEVYEWLKKERERSEDFFSPLQVFEGLVKDEVINPKSPSYRNGRIKGCLILLEGRNLIESEIKRVGVCRFLRFYRFKFEEK